MDFSSIITGIFALAGTALTVCIANKKTVSEMKDNRKLTEYKLEELTKRVEMHNNAMVRIYELEKNTARHDDEFKRVNHRLDELEEK